MFVASWPPETASFVVTAACVLPPSERLLIKSVYLLYSVKHRGICDTATEKYSNV